MALRFPRIVPLGINLFQDYFLDKIQGKTITGSNAKYLEHTYPLLRRQEEKQDLVLIQYCYSWKS